MPAFAGRTLIVTDISIRRPVSQKEDRRDSLWQDVNGPSDGRACSCCYGDEHNRTRDNLKTMIQSVVDGVRSTERGAGAYGAIEPLQAAHRVPAANQTQRKHGDACTGTEQRLAEALGAGTEAVIEIEAAAGVAVGLALRTPQHPADRGAVGGNGLDHLSLLAPDRAQAVPLHAHEEVGILAAGGIEAPVKTVGASEVGPEEHVGGGNKVDEFPGGAGSHTEEAATHNPRGSVEEIRGYRSGDNVGVLLLERFVELVEPLGRGHLIVVEESDVVHLGGLRQGAIACVADATAGFADVTCGDGAAREGGVEDSLAATGVVVVDDQQMHPDHGVGDDLIAQREQRLPQQLGTLVGQQTDLNIGLGG